MDLFDWLDIIRRLRDEGLTQEQIGEKIGWSRTDVANNVAVLDKIVTQVLDLARQHQKGRVTQNVTCVTFDFTDRLGKRLDGAENKYLIMWR